MNYITKDKINFGFAGCSLLALGCLFGIVWRVHGGIPRLWGSMGTGIVSCLLFLLILIINKERVSYEKHCFSACLFFLTLCLQSASAFCYPLQVHKSSLTDDMISSRQIEFLLQICLFFIVYFSVTVLLYVFESLIQRMLKIVLVLTTALNYLFGAYFLATPGEASDIRGIMIGLPLMAGFIVAFSTLYSFHRSLGRQAYTSKGVSTRERLLLFVALLSHVVLILGYVNRHEFGIPIFLMLTLLAWLVFEYHPKGVHPKWKTFFVVGIALSLIAMVFLAYFSYRSYQKVVILDNGSELNGLSKLGAKIARIFSEEGRSTKFVRLAGVFGNSTYLYDFAANNDYALGLQIHNFGVSWLGITLFGLWSTTNTGLHFLSRRRDYSTIMDTVKSISFFGILVLLVYPLLSNIGLLPIIGVSPYATGYSMMHSVLSAMLLALTLFERSSG